MDGRGGALIPGLHDHHLHLQALAAELRSVRCGPDVVRNVEQLAQALRSGQGSGWVRGTGYYEDAAGPLDRDRLDTLVLDRPVRVQHRTGAQWFLNSLALSDSGLEHHVDPAVERDAHGRATGRLLRGDHLLRDRVPRVDTDLADAGSLLASYGVTGVTDATPGLTVTDVASLRAVPQRLLALGAPLGRSVPEAGPWKVIVDEWEYPALADLVETVEQARADGRGVALHCTSRAEVVLAVTALQVADGQAHRDRLEHAGVLPHELDAVLARLGVTVVTQPGFVPGRGDAWLRDTAVDDVPLLYRCGSLLEAGVRVGFGSDAPFGPADPWQAVAAAKDRRTATGSVLGEAERVTAGVALGLLLGELRSPGGPPRRVSAGGPADLCLLDAALEDVLAAPGAERVRATVVAGAVVHEVS